MVRLWAEKEMRNLLRYEAQVKNGEIIKKILIYSSDRLNQAGIPSPKPVLLKMHVLVMTFIGKQGWYVHML
jgi:RIO kinase 1